MIENFVNSDEIAANQAIYIFLIRNRSHNSEWGVINGVFVSFILEGSEGVWKV